MLENEWFEVRRYPAEIYMLGEPGHQQNVKSYLVVGERDVAVLDTGIGIGDFAGLVASLTNRRPIVLQTHAHFDHIGASDRFERLLVHPAEAGLLRAGMPHADYLPWLQGDNLTATPPLPASFNPATASIPGCAPTGELHDGQRIDLGGRVLDVIHTPGHSPGSLTFLDRGARALFTGDALYAGRIYAHLPGSDPEIYRQTFRLLAQLASDVDVVYPAHREVPLQPSLLVDMHDAYEGVVAGRPPDERHPDRDVYIYDDFQFFLPPGWRFNR
jgi:glyoxylase-like metal-dependent hydrolase (beta-lactamase superfamily II)